MCKSIFWSHVHASPVHTNALTVVTCARTTDIFEIFMAYFNTFLKYNLCDITVINACDYLFTRVVLNPRYLFHQMFETMFFNATPSHLQRNQQNLILMSLRFFERRSSVYQIKSATRHSKYLNFAIILARYFVDQRLQAHSELMLSLLK